MHTYIHIYTYFSVVVVVVLVRVYKDSDITAVNQSHFEGAAVQKFRF